MKRPPLIALLVTALLSMPLARAQDTTSANVFVQHVYANYSDPDLQRQLKREDQFYSPQLLRLIAADRRGHPRYVGKLDGDPICDCQDAGDPGELKVQSITFADLTPRTLKPWSASPSSKTPAQSPSCSAIVPLGGVSTTSPLWTRPAFGPFSANSGFQG